MEVSQKPVEPPAPPQNTPSVPLSSCLVAWEALGLDGKRAELDASGLKIADNIEESAKSKKVLLEQVCL